MHVSIPQEIGGTLIAEDRAMVMTGVEGGMVSNTLKAWFPWV